MHLRSTALATVSRETSDRLDLLASLVRKWNPAINLVSKGSLAEVYQRHIADSAQLFDLAGDGRGVWCDMGSGGGFPGLVVAVLAKGCGSAYEVKLIESDSRKAAFLREAGRLLEVNATIINARIEQTPSVLASVVSARALGPLVKLCGFAIHHMDTGGRAFFPKGMTFEKEVAEARAEWTFDLTIHPSKTDPDAAILELENICHV